MSTTPAGPGDLDRLYAYAAWMLGDRTAAVSALRGVAPDGPLLDRLAALRPRVLALAATRREAPAHQRARLDEVLRQGTSVSLRLGPTGLRSGLRRLPVLLTGLLQSCLIRSVGALPPAQREALVLLVVLGLPEPDVLALLGDSPRGFSGVKTRMLQSLGDYLGPRCGHLHAQNPCQCPNRLQLALDQGFVELPDHELPGEGYANDVHADVRRLIAAVPPLRLAPDALAG